MSDSKYAGMTLNERLFAAGLMARFDEAISARDRATLEDLLVRVETEPNLAKVLLGDGFQCWFCGLGIDRADGLALSICLWELWHGGAGDEPTQTIYAHFDCAETRMKGVSMNLEHGTFLPNEGEN